MLGGAEKNVSSERLLIFRLPILCFKYFRYFQGIPGDNPSDRHIYAVKDSVVKKGSDSANTPKCLTCQLPNEIQKNCTYTDAIFSGRLVNYNFNNCSHHNKTHSRYDHNQNLPHYVFLRLF